MRAAAHKAAALVICRLVGGDCSNIRMFEYSSARGAVWKKSIKYILFFP